MLHENTLRLSTIVWREFEGQQRMARVILKRSDRRRFAVTSRSHLPFYLVLCLGEIKIFLALNVFNCTFAGFLCNQIRPTDSMSVDNELQHLALSKIVGKVPYKVQCGFATYHFVVGEPVPYLQGEDNTEIELTLSLSLLFTELFFRRWLLHPSFVTKTPVAH
jgi:hypothetical protein